MPPLVIPADVIAAAQVAALATRVPASVMIAQWALESGWGGHMPSGSNNPFNIKADAGDPFVRRVTFEYEKGTLTRVETDFRRFPSLDAAFAHHERLSSAVCYAPAKTVLPDADLFAEALTGVYATAPGYGARLRAIMKEHDLYRYDAPVAVAG
jgi:flagellum-specific peptidoglycan hydrolase FlgJ